METIYLYFLKASGLMTTFFVAYYFLLRKETFFKSNRLFLIAGLFISVIMPLFFVTKIVEIEAPKMDYAPIAIDPNATAETITNVSNVAEIVTPINWFEIGIYFYALVSIVLLTKIFIELFSLMKVLLNKKNLKENNFKLIDVSEDVAPFSFFNYIVFNSSLYSENELNSILQHEKVHSSQQHSLDVLIANLFTIVFWFNPIVWLYKKAILQNLEFIADNDAVQVLEDKKIYQMALIKVVANKNCLPITNNFNQSLIKKRIIMLNKNQSKRENSWKYGIVLPALVAFVMLFQVQIAAQEKKTKTIVEKDGSVTKYNAKVAEETFDKNTTDKEFKAATLLFKKEQKVDLNFSKIKRNKKGEILDITIDFDNNKGTKGSKTIASDKPIKPFMFYSKTFANGKMDVGFKLDKNEEVAPASPAAPRKVSYRNLKMNDQETIVVTGERKNQNNDDLQDLRESQYAKLLIKGFNNSELAKYNSEAKKINTKDELINYYKYLSLQNRNLKKEELLAQQKDSNSKIEDDKVAADAARLAYIKNEIDKKNTDAANRKAEEDALKAAVEKAYNDAKIKAHDEKFENDKEAEIKVKEARKSKVEAELKAAADKSHKVNDNEKNNLIENRKNLVEYRKQLIEGRKIVIEARKIVIEARKSKVDAEMKAISSSRKSQRHERRFKETI